jgi:nitrate reductase alpha subunit
MPKIETDIDAAEVVLMLAPETNGHVAVKAWEALGKQTGRDHTHLALHREDEKIRFRDIQAQPRKIISSPDLERHRERDGVYNAGYTNVHELIPWRTLTGRQQFYMDHPWMRVRRGLLQLPPAGGPEDHGRHPRHQAQRQQGDPAQLHHAAPEVGHPLDLHRQPADAHAQPRRPVRLAERGRRKSAGIEDNDWIELFNINGAIAARAVVSQRVNPGMVMMYHAQEKIVNTPGSEITGTRGGIHNSVTRIVLKPTHMIGGYAQFSYGFNYYGTIGTNRDEFVVVRKMNKIDWLDRSARNWSAPTQAQGEHA